MSESENLYLCIVRPLGQLRAIHPRLSSMQIDGSAPLSLGASRAARGATPAERDR
jgi:hypothetical protein